MLGRDGRDLSPGSCGHNPIGNLNLMTDLRRTKLAK